MFSALSYRIHVIEKMRGEKENKEMRIEKKIHITVYAIVI